ncbi:TIGR03364 family FAD-dependent oxidoreductase [Bosea sp. BK604]|uniref:TIGR03364 family FAD-dependent oxidoreductase n=1 Tax=Bosea sp. BK604 TaxID=2512180 RepID=UPI001045BBD5|nr:TIGR03364 family FAD-dependent oxidoreductase [Bosea sp. BK604]TCR70335.1 FAD dependent oxidoreductase TIGR03364 [Bosea sp. BK604]
MAADYDLAIVGAGIAGLAHALAGVRRGLKTVVIDRDAQANGASVRNFGFITVTGQQAGATWQRAKRSAQIWDEVAPKAGIRIEHRGLAVASRRAEATAVLEAFLASEMGEGCALVSRAALRERFPFLAGRNEAALWSPHDLRVESKDAIPRLAAHLERDWGVAFRRQSTVHEVAPPMVATSGGTIRAETVVVCPGDDFSGLFGAQLREAYPGLTRCKLQMLRVKPASGQNLPCSVMSDLSLVRYLGYAELPEAAALRKRLESEQAAQLENGIHLIAVASADGTQVVGDSHHYAATPDPFASDAVDELMLDEYEAVLGSRPEITARWLGTYASLPDRPMLRMAPAERVRLVIVTSGTGASTSFAIGEETIAELFG